MENKWFLISPFSCILHPASCLLTPNSCLLNSVEDSVDEGGGIVGSEFFGQFDGLVDDHGLGRVHEQDFIGREP